MNRPDCVVAGFNDPDFTRMLATSEARRAHSGGFRNLMANSLTYRGERMTYTTLLNRVISEATGRPSDLNVFRLPNLAVCYMTSFLRKRGFDVETLNFFNAEQARFAELLARRPRAVAVTTTFYVDDEPIHEIVEFVRRVAPDTRVVVGGPHIYDLCTTHDEVTQDYLFDQMGADAYVFEAQGEHALSQILDRLRDDDSAPLADLPNVIARRAGGGYGRGERVPEDNDLDGGAVDWTLFERDFLGPTVPLRTARSCAFSCAFCSFPLMAGPLRLTSIDVVREEMRRLRSQGVERLIFIDDTFNVPLPRFKKLCRMMIEEEFGFDWYSMFRCANADDEAFDLMAESGCRGVFLGIESGSQQILDNMNKSVKVDRYARGIEKLHDRGIFMLASFIVGFPGETAATVRETAEFVERVQPTFYRAQLYFHDDKLPIAARAGEFGLSGAGYTWQHATMDWREAADWVDWLHTNVTSSCLLPAYGFDLECIPYLLGQGIAFETIHEFTELAHALVVKTLPEHPEPTAEEEDRLLALFGSRVSASHA